MKIRSFDDISVSDILRVLSQKKWKILLVMVLTGILCFAICEYAVPAKYRTSFSFYAWEGMPKTENQNQLVSSRLSYVETSMNFSNRLVSDVEKILHNQSFIEKIREDVKAKHPEMDDVSFVLNTNLPQKTNFIECEVISRSRRLSDAAAESVVRMYPEHVRNLLKMDKIQIWDHPQCDARKFFPKTGLIVTVFVIVSFFTVFAFLFFKDYYRDLILDPEKMTKGLGLVSLGTLPVLHGKHHGRQLIVKTESKHYQYDSMYESFQMLLTNLRYSFEPKEKGNILLMSSAMPGEGKSFVSANLAALLAEKGHKTLLVGCDLRKPALHEFFDVERGAGLVDLVLGEKMFEETVIRRAGGIENLDVLLSGPIPPNAVRIVELLKDSDIFRNLAGLYDYVILDAPPSTEMADVFMLSPLADGIIFVVRSGKTPAFMIQRILNKMNELHFNILGGVLNFFHVPGSDYGYGYGYGYGKDDSASGKTDSPA